MGGVREAGGDPAPAKVGTGEQASEVVQAPARLDPLRVEGPAPGAEAGVAGPGGAR